MKISAQHSGNGFTLPIEERKRSLESTGNCYEWKRKARSRVQGACTVNLLRRRFPILTWLPTYNWNFAIYDIIAGITVGLTTIPQGIAYAAVAGLPLQVKISSVRPIFRRVLPTTLVVSHNSMDSTRLSWDHSPMSFLELSSKPLLVPQQSCL